jgi:hypothetical protein
MRRFPCSGIKQGCLHRAIAVVCFFTFVLPISGGFDTLNFFLPFFIKKWAGSVTTRVKCNFKYSWLLGKKENHLLAVLISCLFLYFKKKF